ncbi:MAG: PAS domain S-box protein, partial [Hyphomicrobium sp.]
MLSKLVSDWRALLRRMSDAALSRLAAASYVARPSPTSDRLPGYKQALEEHFCITVTDVVGRLLEVNDRFCKVLGYSEAELVGQHYELLNAGMRNDRSVGEMWQTVQEGKTWRGELRDRTKNGNVVWFESIVIPRFDAKGRIVQFTTISTDITAIREQSLTLQAMIDNFPGGLALIDRELTVIATNRLYRTLLDIPEELFAGASPKLETLVRFRAERGDYGQLPVEEAVAMRMAVLLS